MSWRARPGRAPYQVPTGPVLSRRALSGLMVLRVEVALKRRHHQPTDRHPALTRVRLGAPPQLQVFRSDIDRVLFPSLVAHRRDDEVCTDLYRPVEMRYGLEFVPLCSRRTAGGMSCHRVGQWPGSSWSRATLLTAPLSARMMKRTGPQAATRCGWRPFSLTGSPSIPPEPSTV